MNGVRSVATALAAIVATAVAALTGCASAASPGASGTDRGGRLQVVAALPALALIADAVGGDRVQVTSLVRPGADAHDLELTPRDLSRLQSAPLVLALSGFQPAVDQATADLGTRVLDVAPAADLQPAELGDDAHADEDTDQTPTDHDHSDEHAGHEHGGLDPHFWLDPERMIAVTDLVSTRLQSLDPEHANGYRERAASFDRELAALNRSYQTGLADCASRELVTSHAAFGYLAARYHLTQLAISGLTPDAEANAGQLRRIIDLVREHDVHTIHTETLTTPALADTIARETGARVATLDTLEGLGDLSPTRTAGGQDYLSVMDQNLATLRTSLECR